MNLSLLKPDSPALVWVDLETTGLKPETSQILEVALVITDVNLNVIDTYDSVIMPYTHLLVDTWPGMEEVVRDMHTKSGLLDECRAAFASTHSKGAVKNNLINRIAHYFPADHKPRPPLCGSTVSFDRAMLKWHMPEVLDLLHYRNMDVSTVKQLAECWRPDAHARVREKLGLDENGKQIEAEHRALPDIMFSIRELKTYRLEIFDDQS